MKKELKKTILTLPNVVTLSRLACVPVVLICLFFPGKTGSFMAALFFAVASLTDILDGFLARKYGKVTVLGKFLDPLVDKILVSVTMIMLIPLGRIPAWMVVIIIAREMALTGLRGIAASDGIVIQAGRLGKYKTFLQSIALTALCIHYTYGGINFHLTGMIVLWAALIMTLWSGWDYFRKFYQVLVPR
jgi:CDP-diacylglycerol--glycerol-3-phosphate 3-phosphatidyltransferase